MCPGECGDRSLGYYDGAPNSMMFFNVFQLIWVQWFSDCHTRPILPPMWASSRDGRKIRFFFHSAWHKWMSRPWVNWRSSVHIHAFMHPVVRRLVYMFILFPIHLFGTSDAPPMPGGCPVKTSAVKKVWRKKKSLLPHKLQTLENHPKSRFRYTKESTWNWTVSLPCCRIRKRRIFCQLLQTCHCPLCAFE